MATTPKNTSAYQAAKQAQDNVTAAQAEESNQRAKAAQAAADEMKRQAGKDQNSAVSTGIYDSGIQQGPSKEALLGKAVYDDGTVAQVEATPKSIHSGDVAVITGTDDKDIVFLTRKAVELNVLVDPKWDANRLRGEIQQAREGRADLQVKGAVPQAEKSDPNYDPATRKDKIELTLARDYFQTEDVRIVKGQKIQVSREEAERLISSQVGYLTLPTVTG